MSEVNYTSLSKAMSKALRHRPERIGLALAPDGSVTVSTLVDALNSHGGWPRELDESDIMRVVEHGSKERFAVERGRIRARYGHSVPLKIIYELAEPPDLLYHGTTAERAESIAREGLLPMGRQTVHLSTDEKTAVQVGSRHGSNVVVLLVDAARAWSCGVSFFRGNDTTWLAEAIPPEFVRPKRC